MQLVSSLRLLVVLTMLFAGGMSEVFAQQTTTPSQTSATAEDTAVDENAVTTPGVSNLGNNILRDNTAAQTIRKTPAEVWLGVQVIFLAVLSLVILCILGRKSEFNAEFQKTFLIIVVISAASFLIVAGYTDQQLAPMFSLFGAIVGYLFGRSEKPASPAADANAPRPE